MTHGNTTHGKTNTRVYKTWESMLARCYNKNNNRYKNYGAKGVTVCERWFKFANFYRDMGDDNGLTLDRKHNNQGYSKANCRWANMKEQQNNRTNNVLITFKNKTQTAKQWSEELNIPAKRIYARKYAGWSDERALTL